MSEENPRKPVYEGKAVDVLYSDELCMSASECNRAKGGLFMRGRDPWCIPDGLSADEVAEIIRRCPAGALAYRRKDGGPEERPEPRNTAVIANNGPIYFRGELVIDGAKPGQPGLRFRAALCRCGRTKVAPYCDDSHEEPLFDDAGAVGERGPGISVEGGPLKVDRMPDGPLLVSGNLTIVAGNGREAWKGKQCELCRCGASGNKPFCDWSHTAAGFKAD